MGKFDLANQQRADWLRFGGQCTPYQLVPSRANLRLMDQLDNQSTDQLTNPQGISQIRVANLQRICQDQKNKTDKIDLKTQVNRNQDQMRLKNID